MNRKICVLTATRAEYGLLYWLMKEVQAEPSLELKLVVMGTHLSKLYGNTVDEILKDGFYIDHIVDLKLTKNDSRKTTVNIFARAAKGSAQALNVLKPDLLVLLGDRYELLGVASAALLMGVPIFHLHGGEITEGAYDDSIRHAVTKMATWHGVAAESYRLRVIQMGEHPSRVFNVGALGLDNIDKLPLLSKEELEASFDFRLDKKTFLVAYHPETNSKTPDKGFDCLLEALESYPDIQLIFSYPNADSGRYNIVRKLENFIASYPDRCRVRHSLGQLRYLSLLQYVDGIVGNSSSGIIEAPVLSTGTINIGNRQKGRLKACSVIDADSDTHSIKMAIEKIFSLDFNRNLKKSNYPYGRPGAAKKVVRLLKTIEHKNSRSKMFYDLPGIV